MNESIKNAMINVIEENVIELTKAETVFQQGYRLGAINALLDNCVITGALTHVEACKLATAIAYTYDSLPF